MRHIVFILFFLLLIVEPSFSEVYKWTDDKGVVHFSDDITNIPEKYRPKTDKVGLPEDRVETRKEGERTSGKKEDTYKDQLGRGGDFWKKRVEEWKRRLKVAQEKMEESRIKYNELTEKFNDSKSSVERSNLRRERDQIKIEMDQYKNQIEEAKMMLEKKIPEEAEIYKAKPEWIKQ